MRCFSALFAAFLLVCLCPVLRVHAGDAAASELLLEVQTGCVLHEENADAAIEPGSFSKLMTAYLTARAIEAGQFSTASSLQAGASVSGMIGAVVWLEPGDSITVDDLLYALLVGNANDAAAVLADAVSGDAAHFVMDMNAAAFDLGMRDTRFTSPQGFEDAAACTTARDLGKLACAVLRCKVLAPYLSTWRTFIRNDTVELVNENTLTRTLDGCCGLKATHQGEHYALMAAAERDGMLCAAVVLDCPDADARFARAKALLQQGFSGYRLAAPGYAEEFLVPLRVRGGTEQAVLLHLAALPVLAVPRRADITSVTVLPEYWQAPLSQGKTVGHVYFYCGDTLLAESTLCAAETVPAMSLAAAWKCVRRALFG